MKKLILLSLILFVQTVFAENWPYPLTSCLSCGGPFDDPTKVTILTHEGRELKFCCLECVAPYVKDSAAGLASLESQIVSLQKDSYPVRTCPVSGHELGGMGEPINYVHGNTLVRFCCAACIEPFEANPASYLAILDSARVKP
ncbi:hypothetical protein IT157_05750 [bacterium]|nr:hypothetical protein [bacterium]